MMKGKLNKTMRDEKGQALIIALVLMLIGSIIVTPLLAYMGSGLKTGKDVYEEKMYGQYAADAGVQDALYRITMDDPGFPGEWDGTWEPTDYDVTYPYSLPQLNGNDVDVTIRPYWLLTGLEDEFQGEMPHSELLVVGDSTGVDPDTGNGIYKISITFEQSQRTVMIDTIGAWLPPGYEYVVDSSNLGFNPSSEDFRGGTALRWVYTHPTKFEDLDLLDGEQDDTVNATFQFTPQANLTSAFSWVKAQPHDIYLSYDANIKIFQIESEAKDEITEKTVKVSAYATQSDPRVVGSGVAGDYAAVGNSLLAPTTDIRKRDQLLIGSEATVSSGDIPSTATVVAAYLYWSGWIDFHYPEWHEGGGPHKPPGGYWDWGEIPELDYDANSGDLTTMVEENAKVNTVSFGVGTDMTDITADYWEVDEIEDVGSTEIYARTWFYTCLYDATELVKQLIDDYKLGSNGTGTYKLEHASTVLNQLKDYGSPAGEYDEYCFDLFDEDGDPTGDYTGYPLGTPAYKLPDEGSHDPYEQRYEAAYAGWSLIIIYSSPETKGHQLYLYDIANPNFTFCLGWHDNPDFDGDGSPGGTIQGFLVPPPVSGEVDAARITCFVGEGDEGGSYTGDYMRITGENGTSANLSDGYSTNDVWNARSPDLNVPGVDIDTFNITWGSGIIEQGDTWAQVDVPTESDGFMMIYIILSFRSMITPGGAVSYVYVGG